MSLTRLLVLLGALACLPGAYTGNKGYLSYRLQYTEASPGEVDRRRGLIERANATLPLFGSVKETG
jgi:hypothetical protein